MSGNLSVYNVNAIGNISTALLNAGQINTTGNILSTGAVHNALTVNGTIISTGFINTTANISSAQLNSGNINTSGNVSISGVNLSVSSSNLSVSGGNLNVNGTIWVAGNILPTANVVYNLGSPTNRFHSAYFSGNTIYLGSESAGVSSDGQGTWNFTSNGSVIQLGSAIPFNPPSANIAGNIYAGNVISPFIYATTYLSAGAVYAPTIGNIGATLTGTLSTASQPNITTLAGVTSIGASSSTTLTGTLQTASQPNITTLAGVTSIGNGANITLTGNLNVTGDINFTGNVNQIQITGNSAQFFGNAAGFGALYAGIGTGYFLEPQTTFQISSNFNGYAMLNMQNINAGPQASSDLIFTPNNGTTNDTFFDIGVASSTYSYTGYTLIKPNDAYVIAYGNTVTTGGNLILSTGLANDIIFSVNGVNTGNEFGRIQASSNAFLIKSTTAATTTTTGALQVAGGVGIQGNLVAAQINTTGNVIAALLSGGAVNVSGNVLAATGNFGSVNATGNVSAATLIAGQINTTGNVLVSVVNASTLNATGNVLATSFVGSSVNTSGNVSAATVIAGQINATGNILTTGAVHNTLTVNGTASTNVASVASTILAGAVGVTGNIIANASVIYGNTSGGYGVRQFFNPITNSLDTVFG